MPAATRTLQPTRRPALDVGLAELAVAVAGAVDPPDLAERIATAIRTEDGTNAPVRVWLLEESGAPRLIIQYPPRSKRPRGESQAVVEAALADRPLRNRSTLLVSLRRSGVPFAVLALDARCGMSDDTIAELAPVVSARLQILHDPEPDRSPSAAIRRAESTDTQAVIAAFAAEAKRLLDHDRLSVYMLTPDGLAFERFAVATSPVLPNENEVMPLEEVGLTYVLQGNRQFVSPDLATDERLVGREDKVIAAAGFHGLVSVPLRIGGTPIGLLNFVSRTPGFYSDEDAAIAQQIANQVAVFFQNLRLEQRVRLAIEREATQQERNRLAHELHDTLAQSLSALLVRFDLVGRRVRGVDPDSENELKEMGGQVQLMLDELRRSLLRLRPAELERRTLGDALAAGLELIEAENGIKTNLELVGRVGGLPHEIETTVFRIFQEAVANARKHAQASVVTVTLRVGEGLVLSIEDNGVGFVASGRSDGYGLRSMRERAEEIGGRLIVTSVSGRGTSVNLSIASLGAGSPPRESIVAPPPRNGNAPPGVMRVLVVDDHPLFRESVTRILEREEDIRVVGQASTAQEALSAVQKLRPDLVLLDVELPDASGIEVVRRLGSLDRPPPTLMISAFPESGQVVAAMKAGARGYLAKTIDGESLVDAMRTIARGATIFDATTGQGLWTPRRLAQLTRRELDVLRLVADGKTNSEVADELALAKKTVERIVATAVAKLRARNRAHAVAKAVALKLIDIRPD